MAREFKQKCNRCKKNYVLTRKPGYIVCYDCQKSELSGEITDPAMKKLFDLPEELYVRNAFLRDIKAKYLKYGSLSDKQIEVFKKVVSEETETQKDD